MENNIYIELYHGRHTPEEEMSDWGFRCPYIIQTSGFIWTYGTIRLFWDRDWECDLKIKDGMIEFMGKYYGDFEVFTNIAERNLEDRKKVIPVTEFDRLEEQYQKTIS